MVEITRQPIRTISLQAGPGVAGSPYDTIFRMNDRAVRAIGQQLAAVGDQLHQEWTNRQSQRQSTLLHMLGPAQAPIGEILRDIKRQMGEAKCLSATVKAWFLGTMTGQRVFETPNSISFNSVRRTDWTKGAVVTVALVVLCSALWVDWKA